MHWCDDGLYFHLVGCLETGLMYVCVQTSLCMKFSDLFTPDTAISDIVEKLGQLKQMADELDQVNVQVSGRANPRFLINQSVHTEYGDEPAITPRPMREMEQTFMSI